MSEELLFLERHFDKLSDQEVFLALLVAESSSGFVVDFHFYQLESKVGRTYT